MPKTATFFNLFAYGSCLNAASLSQTLGIEARTLYICRARLRGWRLAFNYPSTNGRDYFCNIVPDDSQQVLGVLYRVPAYLRESIRVREAWHKGRYREETLLVKPLDTTGPPSRAIVYVANVVSEVEGYPGERYAALIIEGARDYGLPEDYVRAVEAQLARMAAAFLGERQKRP